MIVTIPDKKSTPFFVIFQIFFKTEKKAITDEHSTEKIYVIYREKP